MDHGVQFAVTLGTILTLLLRADNLDILLMVIDNYYAAKCHLLSHTCLCLILGSIALYGGYNTNVWPSIVHDITCSGEETSIFDCAYSLTSNGGTCGSDASVICQGMNNI